jgi:hypothetical protein
MRMPTLLILTTFICSLGIAGGRDALQLLSEIRLTEHLEMCPTKNDPSDHPVFSVSFSPDEDRIAVVLDEHRTSSGSQSHVLIVPTGQSGRYDQFDVRPLFVTQEFQSVSGIVWSPGGDSLIVGISPQMLVSLSDKHRCEISSPVGGWNSFGFADKLHLISELHRYRDKDDRKSPAITEFGLMDFDCHVVTKWEVEATWEATDVSPERGWIAVADLKEGEGERALMVVDAVTGEVKRKWQNVLRPWTALRFADHGRLVCASAIVASREYHAVNCWDVDTAEKVFEAAGVNGGRPLSVAAYGTKVLFSDVKYLKNLFTDGYRRSFRKLVLSDVRQGAEIAAWDLDQQKNGDETDRFAFALSPSGKFYAEAGNGILRLYRITR